MNNKHYIITTVCAALLACISCSKSEKPVQDEVKATTLSETEIALQNIMARTTCRAFQNKEVEQDKVETLLRAAMAAPTALNAQPWHFIIINDRNLLKQLATASPHTGILETAPMAIAVCGDTSKKLNAPEGVYWIQDVSAATENLLLAAQALGLGATWTGSYPVDDRYKIAKEALQLPPNILPVSIVALGYPAMEPQIKDKWNVDNISYNGYQK